MKLVLLSILAIALTDPKDISKVNAIKKQAEKAYLSGDYQLAIEKYSLLSDSLGINEDEITLNLAHAHYNLGDTTGAKAHYGKLSNSSNKFLKSIAYQQLGVMSKDANKLDESLQQLKAAIKANPSNKDAIYNYEVVKKLLEDQEKQQQNQDQQNKDQQNKDQKKEDGEDQNQQNNKDQNQDGGQENEKNKEGENKNQQDQKPENQEEGKQDQQDGEQQEQEKSKEQLTKEKLEKMGISEEKARQLLEAMRQSEIKYLQNQKRKPTERPPSGKPDW